jgi:hypothetical protein
VEIDRRLWLAGSASSAALLGVWGSAFVTRDSAAPAIGADDQRSAFPTLPIGMNLAGIADWEPGFPFRNLFWGARPWITRNFDGSGPHNTNKLAAFAFDGDGYPMQVPVSAAGVEQPQTVFTYLPNCRTRGTYVLLYDGEGDIEGLSSTRVLSKKPGRILLQMAHSADGPEAIVIKRSKAGNHIRNIRIVSKDEEHIDLDASPFLPEFLDFCRPFHCLRFMDWASTNNSIEERWENRKKPSFYTMVAVSGDPEAKYGPAPTDFDMKFSGGVAIELMIQLSNMLQIDPWFCIPHRATDDYIAQFARLVREKLNPERKVYLEYSNEVWNWGFHQAGWMIRSPLAASLVEAKGGTAWKDAGKMQGTNHPERIGALFRRTFAIWEREWRGADLKRLVRVGAVQAAWSDAAQRTLSWCLDNGGVDCVSPAAYVGPDDAIYDEWAKLGPSLTPEKVIADLRSSLVMQRSGDMARTIKFGRERGLRYISYEGGQHIQPKSQAELAYNAALAEAQLHPAMYDLYVELLRLHRDLGCDLFAHFSSVGRQGTRWGSWGAKARYDIADSQSPKMRALLACNTQRR